MAKKILVTIVLLAVVAAAFVGVSKYISSHRTAESVATAFMSDLSKGDATRTYDRFSANLKQERTAQRWQQYVTSLSQTDASAIFVKQANITDRFNVYPANSEPQRFVYVLRVKGRDYQAVTVILKQDGVWRIEDFQGSYK